MNSRKQVMKMLRFEESDKVPGNFQIIKRAVDWRSRIT